MRIWSKLLIGFLFIWSIESSATSVLDKTIPEIEVINQLSYSEGVVAYQKLLKKNQNASQYGAYSYYLGRFYFANGEPDSAFLYWNKGLEKAKTSTDTLLLHKLAFNCGIVKQNEAAYYQAIQYFKKAKFYVLTRDDFAKCNIKIGQCFLELGEYTFAGYYLKWAYSYLVKSSTTESLNLQAQALGALGVIFNAQEQPDSALFYIRKRSLLIPQLDASTAQKLNMPTFINEANAYMSKKQYDSAIKSYLVSLNIALDTENYTYQFRNYSNLGLAYVAKKDFSKAQQYLQKAKSLAIEAKNITDIAAATNTLGDIYFNQQQYKISTQYYFDALNILLPSSKKYDLEHLPTLQTVEKKDAIHSVFEYIKFINKSLVAQALAEQDKDKMTAALRYIHFADSLLFITNQKNVENKSKFYWREQANDLYSLAIEAALFTKNVKEQFYFIERGKYFVLKNLMAENLEFSQLSPEKQLKFNQLRQAISQIEIKQALQPLNEQQYAQLIALKEQYHFWVDSLNQNNTAQNLELKDISFTALKQQFLKNDSTLYVSYLESDSVTYAIYVSQKSTIVKKIIHAESYLNTLQYFIKTIVQPIQTVQAQKEFLTAANLLYQTLLPKSISSYNELIINPSGVLNAVAFDALSKNTTSTGFLIYDKIIRYTLSPSIEMRSPSKAKKTKNQFFYVAPVYFHQIQQQDLPNSEMEVSTLRKLTGGKLLLGKEATKESFQKWVGHYQNVHLATHSMANTATAEFPWIAFYDAKMYLPEIFNLPLQDKFIVLSACETFKGELMVGEGVMNLVWALHYAGSKSMVATLWNTYDSASKDIMNAFYTELKTGITKAEAMRNAKLQYIRQNGFKPDQWASFIYIGDQSMLPIQKNSNRKRFVILGLVIICLLSFLGIRQKMKVKV
jgi:CHAT domain-containing protein